MPSWVDTAISSAAGAFFGALGAWGIVAFVEWWRRPKLQVMFSGKYPYEDDGHFPDGGRLRYLRVKVKNVGRQTAHGCRIFVRRVVLIDQAGKKENINSEELMQTVWVLQEAPSRCVDIPGNIGFLADVVQEGRVGGRVIVQAVFSILNRINEKFEGHIGIFILHIVVTCDNAPAIERPITFRFNGRPLGLFAEEH